jgi:outer membrane murein-binding lipoprotein Lpp
VTGPATAPESTSPLSRLPLLITVLAVALLAGLAGWIGYVQGQRSAGHDAAAEASRRQVLEGQVEQLATSNKRLNAKVAELEMSRRLDRDAYGQVERTLGDLQSQLSRQSDDLAFYRSIVSPADGVQGLRIQRFEVLPGEKEREVRLKLTLVQAMRHESVVSGLAQITLVGTKADVSARYTVGELLGKPRAQLPFSFRYFQAIEQTVTLPEGFQAFEAEVEVHSSKLRSPVEQVFPWKVPGQPVAAL